MDLTHALRSLDRIAGALPLAILLLPIPISLLIHRAGTLRSERVEKQGVGGGHKRIFEIAFWVINPCGRALGAAGIQADPVSWVAMGCGVTAGVLTALGWFGFAGCFLFLAGFLDVVDGVVARYHGTSSRAGAVLDSFLDRPADFAWHAGAAVLWRDDPLLMTIALLAAYGSFALSYSSALAEREGVTVPRGIMKRTERGPLVLLGTCAATYTGAWETAHALPVAVPLLVVTAAIALGTNASAFGRLAAMRRELSEREG